MTILRRIKLLLQRATSSNYPSILVASFGRSGSTILFDAIIASWAAQRFPIFPKLGRLIVSDTAWKLDETEFLGGVVYKTHDLPRYLPPHKPLKVIFIYGQASDSVISVYSSAERLGNYWLQKHFEHLRSKGTLEDMARNDILRYEEQLDSWTQVKDVDFLGVRYEALWRHADELDKFLGFHVELPHQRTRASPLIAPALVAQIRSSYAALDRKLAQMPDVIRIRPATTNGIAELSGGSAD
jgi:hypothetical protein